MDQQRVAGAVYGASRERVSREWNECCGGGRGWEVLKGEAGVLMVLKSETTTMPRKVSSQEAQEARSK